MRAARLHQPDAVLAVAEGDQLLAKQLHPHRRTVALGPLRGTAARGSRSGGTARPSACPARCASASRSAPWSAWRPPLGRSRCGALRKAYRARTPTQASYPGSPSSAPRAVTNTTWRAVRRVLRLPAPAAERIDLRLARDHQQDDGIIAVVARIPARRRLPLQADRQRPQRRWLRPIPGRVRNAGRQAQRQRPRQAA